MDDKAKDKMEASRCSKKNLHRSGLDFLTQGSLSQ